MKVLFWFTNLCLITFINGTPLVKDRLNGEIAEEVHIAKKKDACKVCSCGYDELHKGIKVDCKNRFLTNIPKNIPVDTTSLVLYQNDISNVQKEDLEHVTWLRDLYLSFNRITSLPHDLFDNLKQLERLWLNHNKLTILPNGLFNNVKQLKELYLHQNQLLSLPSDIFVNLQILQTLSLKKNKLISLPFNAFENQKNMTDLELAGNHLKCSCDLFQILVRVIPKLDMVFDEDLGTCDSDTSLWKMTQDNLHKFCKQEDACKVCSCGYDELHKGIKVDCKHLFLTSIPKNIPVDTTSLVLYQNDITVILKEDLDHLTRLKDLYLSFNKISFLPHGLFDNLKQLERVWLNHNKLKILPQDIFGNLEHLRELYLQQNMLTSLPLEAFRNQMNMTVLEMVHNPLKCSCDLFNTLVKVIPKLDMVFDSDLGTCNSDTSLWKIKNDNKKMFCNKIHSHTLRRKTLFVKKER